MDNKDFDKIFSDKLQETQSFEYQETDWEGVSGQLNPPEKDKKRGLFFWLFPFALLLLLGVCVWQAFTLQKTNKHLQTLEKSLSQFKIEQTDTITKVVTIIQYDTIVETTIIPNTTKSNITQKQKNNLIANQYTQTTKNIKHYNSSNTQSLGFSDPTMKDNIPCDVCEAERRLALKEETKEASLIPVTLLPAYLPKLLWLESQFLFLEAIERRLNNELVFSIADKKTPNPTPKDPKWGIGVIGGWASPDRYSALDTLNNFELIKRNAWEVGIRLSYTISPQLSVWSSASLQKLNYQSNTLDTLWGVYPSANLPSTPFDYTKAKIQQQSIQYHLGLNYQFFKNRNWHPFLGLSIEAQSHLQQNNLMTYSLGANGSYAVENVSLSYEAKDNAFRIQAVVPTIGLKLDINQHLQWQGSVWYQIQLNKETLPMNTPLGVRSSLNFLF